MKYYNSSKFTKALTSTGFITVVACLLIAIGAIGWFALSKNKVTESPEKEQSQQSYPDSNSSYYNQVEIPDVQEETPIADVNESVSDVPYVESTEEATPPQEEKASFILPIKGNISKGFSDTALQYSATYDDMRLHTGVDILCENGTDVVSVGSGTVRSVTEDAALGKIITVDYEENITVKYCGMASINYKENDKIATGDVIGTTGEIPSECADKPHIHIEVLKDDTVVSPFEALGLEE